MRSYSQDLRERVVSSCAINSAAFSRKAASVLSQVPKCEAPRAPNFSGCAHNSRHLSHPPENCVASRLLLNGLRWLECVAGVVTDVDDIDLLTGEIDRVNDAIDVGLVAVKEMAEARVFRDDSVALGHLGQAAKGSV